MRITLATLGALAFGVFLTQSATAAVMNGHTEINGDRLIFDEPNNISDIVNQDGLLFDLGSINAGGKLTVTSTGPTGAAGPVIQDLQPPNGGLGVNNDPQDDNIGSPEELTFTFSGMNDFFVEAISFNYGPGTNHADLVPNGETVNVGGTTISFDGTTDDWDLGFAASSLFTVNPGANNANGLYVESLVFSPEDGSQQVPVPATMLLFGMGLLMLGAFGQLRGRSL